jgi:quinol monooxygenase YgiN
MLRIVKLTFQPDKLSDFHTHFETVKWKVASFPGCKGMRLLVDKTNANIVFTYSEWESEGALESYRKSELFGTLWPTIKPWFEKSAEAWSVDISFDGFPIEKTL